MKKIDINNTKEFILEPINGEICTQEPYEENEWTITLKGETINHYISGTYCEPTKDAAYFFELRNYIFDKVKVKEDYIHLPEAKGRYV